MTVNTNITDRNDTGLGAWFEATPEYGKLVKLEVPDPVIGAIEGDLVLYAEEHAIDDFDDIPEGEVVAAIADNTGTQTRLRILWEYEYAGLEGCGDGYTEGIDRDQAVDDDGKAVFDRYMFIVNVATSDEVEPDWRDYGFTVEDIEDFARTW